MSEKTAENELNGMGAGELTILQVIAELGAMNRRLDELEKILEEAGEIE